MQKEELIAKSFKSIACSERNLGDRRFCMAIFASACGPNKEPSCPDVADRTLLALKETLKRFRPTARMLEDAIQRGAAGPPFARLEARRP
jgi:hypothetical protein